MLIPTVAVKINVARLRWEIRSRRTQQNSSVRARHAGGRKVSL